MMKITYILTAIAATSLVSNAATTLLQSTGGDRGNYQFVPFAMNDTGFDRSGDALLSFFALDSFTLTKASGTAHPSQSDTTYLVVLEQGGPVLGTSTNFVNWNTLAVGGEGVFDFTGVTGVDNLNTETVYTYLFSSSSTPTNDDIVFARLEVGTEGNGVGPLTTGGVAANNSFAPLMSIVISPTTIPEPSSTALLGLGGLALILRRRK